MTWPAYSKACRKDVDDLLRKGGSLSAYRANPLFPSWTGPLKGSWAERLERDAERRFGVKHAIAVNSGTAALHAALEALCLPAGSEIITSPFTFSATTSAILLAGHTPVFADVDPYTFCISKETVSRVVTKRTRAILPVHLFGGLAPMRELLSFGLPVVEDACQAVGARNEQGYSGTLGLAGCYSFNGGKNIPAGEAGMLVTNSDKVAEAARLFMNHGESFYQKRIGVNYRLNELTAAVAWHGLQDLQARNQRRQDLAGRLLWNMFQNSVSSVTRTRVQICIPGIEKGGWCGKTGSKMDGHVFYVYPFTIKSKSLSRDLFIKRMKRRGIPVGAGYITPTLDKYPAFKKYARGPLPVLPVVTELSTKSLCILSTLTPDRPLSYADEVAEAMRRALK